MEMPILDNKSFLKRPRELVNSAKTSHDMSYCVYLKTAVFVLLLIVLKRFAGDDVEKVKCCSEYLLELEPRVEHYEILVKPQEGVK